MPVSSFVSIEIILIDIINVVSFIKESTLYVFLSAGVFLPCVTAGWILMSSYYMRTERFGKDAGILADLIHLQD